MCVFLVLFTQQLEQEAGTEPPTSTWELFQGIGALLWATKNDWGPPSYVMGGVEGN